MFWSIQLIFKVYDLPFYLFLDSVVKVVNDSSVKRKSKTPAEVNNKTVNNKCIVPVEPLVFNGDCVTPSRGKRRASRSIPDESCVTPKRSKGCSQGAKRTKEPVTSLRQRFGKCITQDITLTKSKVQGTLLLLVTLVLGGNFLGPLESCFFLKINCLKWNNSLLTPLQLIT